MQAECERRLLAVGVDSAVAVLQAAVEKPFIGKAVRHRATAVLLDNWDALTATAAWGDFLAAHPAAGLVLESAREAVFSGSKN